MLAVRRREREPVHDRLRQCLGSVDRRHPARTARARRAGRRPVLRRADAEHRRSDPDRGDGRGVVNILAADRLLNAPKLYATFLLWMLSELYERLPEVGDPRQAELVFFFDEAHLLFDDAPDALVEKIEQVVRLIRSKGVGVYFVTQNPLDIPETVLGQLGNRVQHALRAFTPRDQKAVARRRQRCGRIRDRRRAGRLPNSPSAKRWSRSSTRRARRRWSSARGFFRRRRALDRSRLRNARRSLGARCCAGTTSRPSIANRRTRN